MPAIIQLSQPQHFITSALANVDLAHWFVWSHGICVGYWDESEAKHSLCCWWTESNRAYLFQTQSITDVCVTIDNFTILSREGLFRWDGQNEIEEQSSPIGSWNKVQLASWGAIGFTQFGYHVWSRDNNITQRLPMGVQKIWALGLNNDILWSHWGQFFVQQSNGVVLAIEPIPDTMERWEALKDGWWVAIYDTTIVVWHPKECMLRFDNSDIMDVSIHCNRESILILLASGSVLQWSPMIDTMPQEIAAVEGEFFIGAGALYVDGEIEFCTFV